MYYIGFDIGGSFIKAAGVKDKKIIKSEQVILPDNFSGLIDTIVTTFSKLKNNNTDKVAGAGFGIAGMMDLKNEKVLNSPNIQYLNNEPLKEILSQKLGNCPIKISHDVHCFLLAEKEIGAAKNLNNVFYLTLGTGIGGAWMVDGKIQHGAHNTAGEAGHMIMDITKKLDYEELAANKFIRKHLAGDGSIKAAVRAREGDKQAQEVLALLGQNIGVGLANIINIFDPEAIILSGGVTDCKDYIIAGIKEGIERFVVSPEAKKTEILFSQTGKFGGALGATMLFG